MNNHFFTIFTVSFHFIFFFFFLVSFFVGSIAGAGGGAGVRLLLVSRLRQGRRDQSEKSLQVGQSGVPGAGLQEGGRILRGGGRGRPQPRPGLLLSRQQLRQPVQAEQEGRAGERRIAHQGGRELSARRREAVGVGQPRRQETRHAVAAVPRGLVR